MKVKKKFKTNQIGSIYNIDKGANGQTSVLCDNCLKSREALWTKNGLIWQKLGESSLACEECGYHPEEEYEEVTY